MASNETVLKIRAEIENLQGLEKLKSAMRRVSAESDGAGNNFSQLIQKVRQLQSSSVKSVNNLNAQRDAFEALRRSVDVTSKEFKEAKDEIEKIDKALKKASGTVVRYSKNSINALRAQKNSLLAVRDSADLMSKEFKKAGIELGKLDKKLAKAERRGSGGGRFRGAAQIAGTVAGAGVFGGPEGAIGALAGGVVGGVPGAIVGATIGAQLGQLRKAAGAVAEYNAKLNLAKATLGGVSTDIVDYNKNLKFARRISNDYAVSLLDVIKGYTGVAAAGRANNLTVKQTQGIYEGITASGVAFGKSQEDLQALFLATTQVLSKGKATAEEISGQIGERIPGAVAKFAEATNRTLPQLAKDFQLGKVTIADFVLFAEKQGKDYAEFAKSLASGPEKAGLRLDIALKRAMEIYGSFFGSVGAGFQGLLKGIVDFVIDNEKQIKMIIGAVVVAYEDISSLLKDLGGVIAEIFGPVFKFLLGNIKAVVSSAVKAINTLLKLQQIDEKTVEGIKTKARKQVEAEFGGFLGTGAALRANESGPRYQEVFNQLMQAELDKVTLGPSFLNRAGQKGDSLFSEYKPSKFARPNKAALSTGNSDEESKGNGSDGGGSGSGSGTDNTQARIDSANEIVRKLRDQLAIAQQQTEVGRFLAKQAKERSDQQAAFVKLQKDGEEAAITEAQIAAQQLLSDKQKEELNKRVNDLYEQASKGLKDTLQTLRDKVTADKEYARLIAEGVNPELAKELININKTFEAGDKKLQQRILDLEAQKAITGLSAEELQNLNDQIEAIERKREALGQDRIEAEGAAGEANKQPTTAEGLKSNIADLKKELEELLDPVNQITGAANAIGTAFTDSFRSVIDGSATTQEALASFFKNIGNYFLDMAMQIIQKMITMYILNTVLKVLPGFSNGGAFNPGAPSITGNKIGDFGGGTPLFAKGGAFAKNKIVPYAKGGIVNKPTMFAYANGGAGRFGIMGEAGPEAILPLQRGPGGKLGVQASGGGVGNVVVNVDASGSSVEGDSGQASQLGKRLGSAVQAELIKQKRPGGLLAS